MNPQTLETISVRFYDTLANVGLTRSYLDELNSHEWWGKNGFNLQKFSFTRIEHIVALELAYFVSVSTWTLMNWCLFEQDKKKSKTKKRDWASYVIAIHNFMLSIFSGYVFFNTFPIIFDMMINMTFEDFMCKGMKQAYEGSYGTFSVYFYLSKYYEFFDTYVVLSRGKVPMFLQPYHHMGAPLGMWLTLTTSSPFGFIFVILNSFVHWIMYFYYGLASLRIKVPGKRFVTLLQMFQFVTGMAIAIYAVFMYDCLSLGDKINCAYHETLSATFLVLFYRFYRKAYATKKEKKP